MQENQIKGKTLFYTEDCMLYQIVTQNTQKLGSILYY